MFRDPDGYVLETIQSPLPPMSSAVRDPDGLYVELAGTTP
jgi:hypothetical protein